MLGHLVNQRPSLGSYIANPGEKSPLYSKVRATGCGEAISSGLSAAMSLLVWKKLISGHKEMEERWRMGETHRMSFDF